MDTNLEVNQDFSNNIDKEKRRKKASRRRNFLYAFSFVLILTAMFFSSFFLAYNLMRNEDAKTSTAVEDDFLLRENEELIFEEQIELWGRIKNIRIDKEENITITLDYCSLKDTTIN